MMLMTGQLYRTRRNDCTKRQRNDRSKHYNELYNSIEVENDSKKLFNTTKNLLGWKQDAPPKGFMIDGKFISKQKEVAEEQAKYYENKIKKIKNSIPKVNFDPLYVLKKAYSRWRPVEQKT